MFLIQFKPYQIDSFFSWIYNDSITLVANLNLSVLVARRGCIYISLLGKLNLSIIVARHGGVFWQLLVRLSCNCRIFCQRDGLHVGGGGAAGLLGHMHQISKMLDMFYGSILGWVQVYSAVTHVHCSFTLASGHSGQDDTNVYRLAKLLPCCYCCCHADVLPTTDGQICHRSIYNAFNHITAETLIRHRSVALAFLALKTAAANSSESQMLVLDAAAAACRCPERQIPLWDCFWGAFWSC